MATLHRRVKSLWREPGTIRADFCLGEVISHLLGETQRKTFARGHTPLRLFCVSASMGFYFQLSIPAHWMWSGLPR
jgi:hypothetical protein